MSRSPPKRGRPPRNEKNKTILLRESTFNLWNQRKIDLGFQGNTNSEFAEFLLHTCSLPQWQFEQESVRMDDGAEGKNTTAANSRRSLIHSTPAKAEMAAVTRLSLSPVVASNVPNERYEIFLCRILLAALDHNFHAFRELVGGRYKRVYSKHSKNWHVVPVKEEKLYKYWDVLLSKILKARADDNNCIVRHVEVSPTNPQNLSPTIAMREPLLQKTWWRPSCQDLNLRNNCVRATFMPGVWFIKIVDN